MRLTRATQQAIKFACLHFHYSKAVPANPIGYNVYNDADEWCGVVLFGTGATPNIGMPYNLPQGGGAGIDTGCLERQAGPYQPGRGNGLESIKE